MIRLAGHEPESATFATKAEAQAWADEREDALRAGAGGAGRTFADALRAFLRDVTPSHRGARWERVRIASLLDEGDLSSIPLVSLDPPAFAAWRDRRLSQVSAGTVLREMTLLRSVCEYARRDLGWLASNPLRDVRKPSPPPHRDRRISEDEILRLRLALGWPSDDARVRTYSQQIAVMMLLAIETAMRAGELHALTWPHVHLAQRFVRLPMTKNGSARDVPLTTRAVELLNRVVGLDETRVFTVATATRDALFRRAREAAEISDLRFHDTRHEAITRLARKLDVLDLARMVGHHDLGSLRAYYNATASEIAGRLG